MSLLGCEEEDVHGGVSVGGEGLTICWSGDGGVVVVGTKVGESLVSVFLMFSLLSLLLFPGFRGTGYVKRVTDF